jgi:hypothetical protein
MLADWCEFDPKTTLAPWAESSRAVASPNPLLACNDDDFSFDVIAHYFHRCLS